MAKMAECAWQCGDPGVQYDTTINRWHTCPNSGRINASNPCSEYMFLDDTACNLASINLMKFRQERRHVRRRAVRSGLPIYFIAQEILVDHASYPTASGSPRTAIAIRPLGLGYSNLGSLVMASGAGLRFGRRARGTLRSDDGPPARLGQPAPAPRSRPAVGPFEGFAENREPMLHVMQMHRDAVEEIDPACPDVSSR